ncbi:hypothetical protein OVY48_22495 [Sphingobium sp. SA2]|uniref:hypothetical protein n=1 Tax=Sphingobium sp. SA2 TaxID=1524832 RepID=UPI0028C24A47|nr:hypothetical protein [Sphingobium sp. SA2]MDT7536169.1 hypothetical protein [Sphingobium sp. SA2]
MTSMTTKRTAPKSRRKAKPGDDIGIKEYRAMIALAHGDDDAEMREAQKMRADVGKWMSAFQDVHNDTKGDLPCTYRQKDHWAFLDLIALAIGHTTDVQSVVQQMAARIVRLEQAAQKASPPMIYRGVFADGETYDPGNTATYGGSLWHCNEATKERPGDASKAWTLCVKRGRDGKDLRP